jgi:hypothetical protein
MLPLPDGRPGFDGESLHTGCRWQTSRRTPDGAFDVGDGAGLGWTRNHMQGAEPRIRHPLRGETRVPWWMWRRRLVRKGVARLAREGSLGAVALGSGGGEASAERVAGEVGGLKLGETGGQG